MVIWPHKRKSGKTGQTPQIAAVESVIGAEKGLFEYCVVGLSCVGQNAKAQIVEIISSSDRMNSVVKTHRATTCAS
jgi:hypothetical protein